jgi:predicted AAA+ superfamily ATPase
MFDRLIERRAIEVLSDTPALLVIGPRRAGKTTLARKLGAPDRPYITLDDQTNLEAARNDPAGFIRGLDRVTIDEVQRAPDLLLAIKKSIDEDYRPGRFLLTGSANILTLPRVADSLAGRMETLSMLPLARVEIEGRTSHFLENLFDRKLTSVPDAILGNDLVKNVIAGGFPEALVRDNPRRQQDWMRAYLSSVLTRDLRDIADIEKLTEIPRFMQLLAEHAGQLVNASVIGSGVGISHKTAQRYIALFEQLFLVTTLQPWFTNVVKRIVKTPKLHFIDSGLLAATRGVTFERIIANRSTYGSLLETFVLSEVMKLMTGSELRLKAWHFRDHQQREVDIVLERDDGKIVGIEIKASATVKHSDFNGLETLAQICGNRFAQGIILYDSTEHVSFGEKLAAVPISALWN